MKQFVEQFIVIDVKINKKYMERGQNVYQNRWAISILVHTDIKRLSLHQI